MLAFWAGARYGSPALWETRMAATLALIDYGSGNLRSAEKALARAATESGLALQIAVTSDADVVRGADRIVLPGVGAFADCMAGLSALPGMGTALNETVTGKGRPFLGICVGMQLMARVGREFGDTKGLGWIDGEVTKLIPLPPASPSPSPTPSPTGGEGFTPSLKIPHMGWNELRIARPHPLFNGLEAGAHAYFVHSFAFRAANDADVLATTDYGGPVVAAIGRDNLAGTQFHPEKSQAVGLRILSNFLNWRP